MSNIICSSCTVKVPEEKKVGVAIKRSTGKIVPLSEVTKAWEATKLPPKVLMAYLNGGHSHKALPAYEFRKVKKTVTVEKDKVFDGTEDQALKAGWVQNEFGWCCVDCSGTAHETEDASVAFEGKDLATLVAVQAALPPDLRRQPEALRKTLTGAVVKEARTQGLLADDDE